MVNGAFMEDLSELLNSATGDQRRRKSFYEIDTEFEKMTASLLKNFNSMASLMSFLRESTSDNDSQALYCGQGQGRSEER
jgi:hypothetical protein